MAAPVALHRDRAPRAQGRTGRATAIRGIEGFGASSRIHTKHLFRLSNDLPVLIVIIDAEDRIRGFLPQLDDLNIGGLVMLDEVHVVKYTADRR
ncbi:hypothetical protein GCM10022267_34680 [Lentzea roselyniae]|uniref:DUF190 domain-containing protein n=1 Tax=Lentzea roselyniae TaxID=531940 RepID=A0ABP7B1F6_9PSEU